MTALWIGAGVALVLVVLPLIYWMVLRSMYSEQVRTSEVYTITTGDLWKIRVCRYRRGRTQGEPILLCHGAGANHHNFTCPEGFSLVDYLIEQGYDCWAVDLRGCRSSEPPFGRRQYEARIDDYLLQDLPAVMERICRVTGYDRVHWIGHSLGGFLLYAYALEYGDRRIASAVSIAAPIGFDGTSIWAPRVAERLLARFPGLTSKLVRAYAPVGKALHLPLGLFPVNLHNVHPRVTAEHFFVMLDNILPDIFLTLSVWARKKNMTLKNGILVVKEGLSTLRFPILTMFAPRDPFISLEYAWRFFEQLPAHDKEMVVLSKAHGCVEDYDHVEIPFSREVRREVFSHIGRWLAGHPCPRVLSEATDASGQPAPHATPLPISQRHDILSGSSFEHLVRGEQDSPDNGGKPGSKQS